MIELNKVVSVTYTLSHVRTDSFVVCVVPKDSEIIRLLSGQFTEIQTVYVECNRARDV